MRSGLVAVIIGVVAMLAACRSEVREAAPSAHVNHRAHAVEGINCVRCHQAFKADEPADTLHLPADSICVECHADSHPDETDRACANCHVDEDTPAILRAVKADLRFQHGPHLKETHGDCVKCHRGAIQPTESALGALPLMAECGQCHQNWLDDANCAVCHESLTLHPLRPITDQAHAGDFLRRHALEGRANIDMCAKCHSQSSCAECHDRRAPMPANLVHADRPDRGFVHRPGYVDRHATEARLDGPMCLSCHGESDCATCHAAVGRGPGGLSPHPAAWATAGPGANRHAAEARNDLLTCAACHSGPGADLCVECHAPGGPGGTPHGGSSPPGDKHRDLPCRRCHR